MNIKEYESFFYALSEYDTAHISIENKRIIKFVKGLLGYYQLGTIQLVVLGCSF